MNKLHELLNQKEELHPDLKNYVRQINGIPCLHHPLMVHLFYNEQMNAFINKSYMQKLECIEKLEKNNDFSRIIAFYERPYRWDALTLYMDRMEDNEYWESLGFIWSDTENLWQVQHLLPLFLNKKKSGRENMMEESERDLLNRLPDRIRVFRGHQKKNKEGWSWSLSYWTACWFSNRFEKGSVVCGYVNKKDIIALLLGRNEWEVAVDPKNVDMSNPHLAYSTNQGKFWAGLRKLQDDLISQYKLGPSSHHGPWHWSKVSNNCRLIQREIANTSNEIPNGRVTTLFSLIHDSQRIDENEDKEHGKRAAKWIKDNFKNYESFKFLKDDEFDKLIVATEKHNDGDVSEDSTVGTCWDADRLDLIRVGIVPNKKYLSTEAAKNLIFQI